MESISIVHITNNPLTLEDNSYCYSSQKINYKILYYPLSPKTLPTGERFITQLKSLVERLKSIKDEIVSVFIFSDNNEEENRKNFFTFTLIYISQIFDNEVIYALYNPKINILLLSEEEIQRTAKINGFKRVLFKRFLNVMPTNWRAKRSSVKKDNITYPILYVSTKSIEESQKSQKLSCQWWFSYLINLFSQCGKGRFLQISGTCYLNALINGLILSSHLGKMMLMYLNERLDSPYIGEVMSLKSLLREKDILTCPSPYTQKIDPDYFFKLLYNIFCKKISITESLRDGGEYYDIIVEYSKRYSVDPVSGQGGYFSAFYKLLDHCVLDKQIYYRYGVGSDSSISNDIDIFISDERPLDFIEEMSSFLSIEFSFIVLLKPHKEAHGVCGFVCNNEYYIYDSAGNLIYNIDWRKPEELETFRNLINKFNEKDFTQIYVDAIVYSNPTRWSLYETKGVCPEI